jgi:integrase
VIARNFALYGKKFVFIAAKVRICEKFQLLRKAMNKKTIALTAEQYREIISTIRKGFCGCRPNERIATALILEANLGLRISDILKLRLRDILRDGERYRLDIKEQKTGKSRTFTVPLMLYQFIRCYCLDHGIESEEVIFPITERAVQKQLQLVCEYLGISGVSTHSFRKFYATEIYRDSGYNIVLVQQLLQHSSAAVTQRYIGIQPQEIEEAIERHLQLDI